MLIHEMKRASVPKQMIEDFDNLLEDLPEGFRRAFFPARQGFLTALEVSEFPSEPRKSKLSRLIRDDIIKSELVITGQHIFILEIIQDVVNSRTVTHLAAPGQLGTPGDDDQFVLDLDCYGPDVMSHDMQIMIAFVNAKFSVTLEPHYYPSRRMDELKAEGREPPPAPTKEEITASQILSDRSARALAIAVRQAGGLLSDDLARQLPDKERSRAEEIRRSLEESGVFTSETVVICKKTGSQVIIVPEAPVGSALAPTGFKCPCGTPIGEEKIDTAFSISDDGGRLLDGNRWFTILLIEHLLSFGVPLEDILIDQVSGGDEMDCIAAIEGAVALFELKAKEFNLGNAYSFGAKIGIIEPDYPVIVTTHHVGADAREHFARARRKRNSPALGERQMEPDVIYMEGIENFRADLVNLIDKISMERFSSVLPQVTFSATLPILAIEQAVRNRCSAANRPAASLPPPT